MYREFHEEMLVTQISLFYTGTWWPVDQAHWPYGTWLEMGQQSRHKCPGTTQLKETEGNDESKL